LNLKGQVYLLTIENEMMKRTVASGTVQPPPSMGQRSSAPSMSATFVAASPRETTASLVTPFLPPAEYPSEIGGEALLGMRVGGFVSHPPRTRPQTRSR